MYFPEPEVLLSPISWHPEKLEPRAFFYREGVGFGTIQRFKDENDNPSFLLYIDDFNVTLNGLGIINRANAQKAIPGTESTNDIERSFRNVASATIRTFFYK